MIIHGDTFIGGRKENQDRFLIFSPTESIIFLAVADGMGGSTGGGIASQLVIETTEKVFTSEIKTVNNPSQLKSILHSIYSEAQLAIRSRTHTDPLLNGMGSTLCCMIIQDNKYVWGNLGDSRIYKFNSSQFTRITKDHTQIEDYMRGNTEKISDEMILNFGHLLTRSINGGNDLPDIYPLSSSYNTILDGEGFLLCSDGLLLEKHMDENPRFLKYLNESESIENFIEKLIYNTYEMGSTDNITCIAALNHMFIKKSIG